MSAERARAGLRGLVPDERVDEVARLVLLTAGHSPEPGDANGAVLCDADLAVLAGPPDAYAAYASAVREEYGHLSDEEFTAGRIAVLEHLLALPLLYRLPAVADVWTPRARANLTAELTLLRSRRASGTGLLRTEPRRQQPTEQLPRADRLRTGRDGDRVEVLGDVVVVALERAPRDAELPRDEGVQLLVGDVADQVRPQPPAPVPDRGVDQHCHGTQSARPG